MPASSVKKLDAYGFMPASSKATTGCIDPASHGSAAAKRYEFLANMSHEIRMPLNGVLAMAELLARSDLDSRQKTFLDIIVKSGDALRAIIDDLLDFSMIDAGQIALDPAPFALAKLIDDAVTQVSSDAREKNLELIMRIQPDLHGHYIGDAQRLHQIIINLLGNAIRFTDTGHVFLDINGEDSSRQSMLHIAITDTGIGIPQNRIDRIFDKAVQADASLTECHHGAGLGLAIASRLVALMGGKIGAYNHEEGGSTFYVTLNLPQATTPSKKQPVAPDISGARILVVDDNPISRAVLTEQITFWGFDACAAQNSEECLCVLMAATALNLPLDCLILDDQMPEMSGAEMVRLMQSTPGIEGVPVIMLTTAAPPVNSPIYRALPIDQHIMKPALSSVLYEAIVALIRENRVSAAAACQSL